MLVVYFRTLLNGWVTSRRMRTLNGVALHNLPPCPMCNTGQDGLEHFAYCKWTIHAFKKLNVPINNMAQFLMLDHACTSSSTLRLRAKALSAVYSLYCTMSHLDSDSRLIISPEQLLNVALAR